MSRHECDNSLKASQQIGAKWSNESLVLQPEVAEELDLCTAMCSDADDAVMVRFRSVLKCFQASELERLFRRLPELDDRSRYEICQFANCVVAKMLEPPLESLRHASRNGSEQVLLSALERLFQLQGV